MQGIYIPETNYVPREYGVAAILLFLFMVLISLVSVLSLLYFYISTFRSMCAVPNMAVFCIIVIIMHSTWIWAFNTTQNAIFLPILVKLGEKMYRFLHDRTAAAMLPVQPPAEKRTGSVWLVHSPQLNCLTSVE